MFFALVTGVSVERTKDKNILLQGLRQMPVALVTVTLVSCKDDPSALAFLYQSAVLLET